MAQYDAAIASLRAPLPAADLGPLPRLIRIETRAGHGADKPTDKIIAKTADLRAFAAHWTGLEVVAANLGE